jgi:hypothetical protein
MKYSQKGGVSIWNREEGYYHWPNPWFGVLSLVMGILFCSRIRKLFENILPNSRFRPLIKRNIHKQLKLLSLAKQICYRDLGSLENIHMVGDNLDF